MISPQNRKGYVIKRTQHGLKGLRIISERHTYTHGTEYRATMEALEREKKHRGSFR